MSFLEQIEFLQIADVCPEVVVLLALVRDFIEEEFDVAIENDAYSTAIFNNP